MFAEAQTISRTPLKRMGSHLLLIWYFHDDQDKHHGCPQHQWHHRLDALQDQVRIEGGCQDGPGGRRQEPWLTPSRLATTSSTWGGGNRTPSGFSWLSPRTRRSLPSSRRGRSCRGRSGLERRRRRCRPSTRRGSTPCSRRWSGARLSSNTCWTPWKSPTPISIIIVTIYK